jgi:hypothetical protein
MKIGISGARSLTECQSKQLQEYMAKMPQSDAAVWHIGDAKGVDQIARLWATENNITIEIYNAISRAMELLWPQRPERQPCGYSGGHG